MRALLGLAVGLAAAAIAAGPAAAETLPANFRDDLVTSVSSPTAIAFTPDGRMLITTQGGALYVYAGGSLVTTPALDLSAEICSTVERGMLGVAVDPSFTTNHFIYVYYTVDKAGRCVNRASRFVLSSANSATSETVLLDNIPSPAGNHNGGDLNFGPDGLLYVGVGDGGCDYAGNSGCGGANDASRDRNVLLGKILRITRNGGAPLRNPFNHRGSYRCAPGTAPAGAVCREIYAWGFRNPFRFSFDPNTISTRFFVNDVGQDTWEEIDLGQVGADYGWNVREGHCATGSTTSCGSPPAGMTNPIYDYGHANGCGAITGGAFVPNGVWPGFDGAYIYADFNCGAMYRLDPSGAGYASTGFASGLGGGSAVHLEFGPYGATQALYYTTYASGGQIRRIAYQPPAAIPGVTTGPFAGL